MRLPFALQLQRRRGLLVYQLVLILMGIILLILVLFYIARRNHIGTNGGSNSTKSAGEIHRSNPNLVGERFSARSVI